MFEGKINTLVIAIFATVAMGAPRIPVMFNITVKNLGSENPTHYGPPSIVGGQCKSDETEYGYYNNYYPQCGGVDDGCGQCAKSPINSSGIACEQDSDCPQDKPPGTIAKVTCNFYQCELICDTDADCPLGGLCMTMLPQDPKWCVYRPSKDCYYIQNVVGKWVSISSSSGNQDVKYEMGTTHTDTSTDETKWGASVTTSVTAGFSFFGASGSATVSGTVSASIASSYSSTFSSTKTVTYDYQFGPGDVWQWQFDVNSPCGKATSSGHDLALTPNGLSPPCCLPAMFVNITEPNGGCLSSTPNLCK